MKKIFLTIVIAISILGCNKAKQVINKSGETVGNGATEFINGVSDGVDKSLECEIKLSKELSLKGLKTGKYTIENDSLSTNSNKIEMYFIFDMDLSKTISVKVFDKNNLEYGRTTLSISGKMNDAKYYDIVFDKRTNITSKSKIEIE